MKKEDIRRGKAVALLFAAKALLKFPEKSVYKHRVTSRTGEGIYEEIVGLGVKKAEEAGDYFKEIGENRHAGESYRLALNAMNRYGGSIAQKHTLTKKLGKREESDGGHASSLPAILAILGLIIGSFFLAESMTGDAIGMSSASSSIIGALIFIIGSIGGFFWLRRH